LTPFFEEGKLGRLLRCSESTAACIRVKKVPKNSGETESECPQSFMNYRTLLSFTSCNQM